MKKVMCWAEGNYSPVTRRYVSIKSVPRQESGLRQPGLSPQIISFEVYTISVGKFSFSHRSRIKPISSGGCLAYPPK
jgi:hypothetical protein